MKLTSLLPLNEDLSNFTDKGIPAAYAKGLLRTFRFKHTAKITPLDKKPKTSDIVNGQIIINVLPNGDVVSVLKRQTEGYVNRQVYTRATLINNKFTIDSYESIAKASSGMSAKGKYYIIDQMWGSAFRADKQTPAEVDARTYGDTLAGSAENIYGYMNKTFMPKIRKDIDAKIDYIYANLRRLGNSRAGTLSFLKTDQETALEAVAALEKISKNGFTRETMEDFLRTMGKAESGWGYGVRNERNLVDTLKNDPTSRAQWAKVIVDRINFYYDRVKKLVNSTTVQEDTIQDINEAVPAPTQAELKAMRADTEKHVKNASSKELKTALLWYLERTKTRGLVAGDKTYYLRVMYLIRKELEKRGEKLNESLELEITMLEESHFEVGDSVLWRGKEGMVIDVTGEGDDESYTVYITDDDSEIDVAPDDIVRVEWDPSIDTSVPADIPDSDFEYEAEFFFPDDEDLDDEDWDDEDEFYEEYSLKDMILDEALSTAARMKKKQIMRRKSALLRRKKAIAAKKLASPEKLKKRALKKAHNVILKKKILKNRNPADLSMAEKARIEQKMQKFQPIVKKLAKKLYPKIKKAENARLAAEKKKQSSGKG